VLRYVGVSRHVDRHQIEFSMTLLLRLCRQLIGQRLAATSARLMHWRGSDASELAVYFGGNMEFSATADEFTFAREANEMRVVSADPYLNKLLVTNCEEVLSRRPARQGTFRSLVENAMVPLLPHGNARASEIAKRLGVSQRTAARRLADEGLSFSAVLESLRSDLAQQYLGDPALSISRVAWLLGYREVSAFTHAFKRWTGKTPRQTRQPPAY
jgi:AraC-like DNA-binding protein